MGNRREYVDDYAETQVLPSKVDATPATGSGADSLSLYEEYARELARPSQPAVKTRPAARPKR